MKFLDVQNINVWYGHVQALRNVTMEVGERDIISVIGANGAGKSTLLSTIAGLLKPKTGMIYFAGKKIDTFKAHQIARLGISLVPEGRHIFPGLTVFENLEVATASWSGGQQKIQEQLNVVFSLFPRLKERIQQLGWSLSGGEQQMLAIARGVMAGAKMLLLDEPSLGLAPNLTKELFRVIKRMNEHGTTILLVEQNAAMALKIASHGYVLEHGEIVLKAESASLLQNPRVKEAYLGA
jgi:branched-chain amino acid transport system ATP-binding protein